MQQFALVSSSPRSIAWLLRSDEWERFEIIIKYNCAMLGGYYNVIIPLTDQDTLSEEYHRFLLDYDPDLIVLAPGMQISELNLLFGQFHPFCFIPWGEIGRVATLDPLGRTSEMGIIMSSAWVKVETEPRQFSNMFLAVADHAKPDLSKLALVACGDIEPRELDFDVVDGNVHVDGTGYLETFLLNFLKPEYGRETIEPYLEEGMVVVPNFDRYSLKDLLKEENCFPLSGITQILNTCFKLQRAVLTSRPSFIGLTADYKTTHGTPQRINSANYPAIVVLVSEQFGLEEAILFWNLRASQVYVAWLSFSEIENNLLEIARWLESDRGGAFYATYSGSFNATFSMAFSSTEKDRERLSALSDLIKNSIQAAAVKDSLSISTAVYGELICYDYIRPYLKQVHVPIIEKHSKITFLPNLPQEYSGICSVALKWPSLMLPQGINTSDKWRPSQKGGRFYMRASDKKNSVVISSWKMHYCRVNNNHNLLFQVEEEAPIEIDAISSREVISAIFLAAHFSRIDPSNTARYHAIFLERAGDLDQAVAYLADPLYRSLLETLADNSSKSKTGWLLDHPSTRRVFNHFQLWEMANKPIFSKTTEEYYKWSDKLPEEVVSLLERRILERGFLVKCNTCSFKSWYPAELIGQDFICARCFQTQVYQSNPLWLYKLPEVIFQGFDNHMEVPLLTLGYMKRKSKLYFDWIPDSDVIWMEGQTELSRNIDIICLCDGELYIGEAKSSNAIEKDQFLFYQKICQEVAIDGIIFATSQKRWDKKTRGYIETLKQIFSGKVLILTEEDLYPRQE